MKLGSSPLSRLVESCHIQFFPLLLVYQPRKLCIQAFWVQPIYTVADSLVIKYLNG